MKDYHEEKYNHKFKYLIPFYPSDFFSFFKEVDEELFNSIQNNEINIQNMWDMNNLCDQYASVIRDRIVDRRVLMQKCNVAQSLIQTAVNKYDDSKYRLSTIKSDVICVLSLVTAIVSILFSKGLLDDFNGSKVIGDFYSFYETLYNKMSLMDKITGVAIETTILLMILFYTYETISSLIFRSKTRRRYLTSIQCFDVLKMALLKVEDETLEELCVGLFEQEK